MVSTFRTHFGPLLQAGLCAHWRNGKPGSGGWNRRTFIAGGIAAATLAVPLLADAQTMATDGIVGRIGVLTDEMQHIGAQLVRIDEQLIDPPDTRVIDELTRFQQAAAGVASFAADMLRRRG